MAHLLSSRFPLLANTPFVTHGSQLTTPKQSRAPYHDTGPGIMARLLRISCISRASIDLPCWILSDFILRVTGITISTYGISQFSFNWPFLWARKHFSSHPLQNLLTFSVIRLPLGFCYDRFVLSKQYRSPFVQQASWFEDIVIRCVRYAFAYIPASIGRVFFSKPVSLPFLRFRMLRHGCLRSPIHWHEVNKVIWPLLSPYQYWVNIRMISKASGSSLNNPENQT